MLAERTHYISGVTTTLDYGASAQVQTRTEQTLDAHGNVTQSKVYDYGNPLPSTAARTYNNTYVTNTNYTSRHIWNRLLTSAVFDGTNNVTLISSRSAILSAPRGSFALLPGK